MSFLETTQAPEAAHVWPTLEQAQKEAVLGMLARLIAKAANASKCNDVEEEERDE